GMLLLLLATRRYDFIWETTLLGGETFVALTRSLGTLPALLGFPLPAVDIIRASGNAAVEAEAARQAWSVWLLGVLVIYGILPRFLLAAFCWWQWRKNSARLALDLALPGYGSLRERLQPSSERLGVADKAPASLPMPEVGGAVTAAGGAVLVAIELDSEYPWPPPLPEAVTDAGILDSREQRRQLLDQLSLHPPARLVIACDPRRSPDRGTMALIAELARTAAEAQVSLLPALPGERLDAERLTAWRNALQDLRLPYVETVPLEWLATGRGGNDAARQDDE
ncbi:MAG TPA: DUF2868 domain-containing protein, partial [Gammaproteobacteria bacterium]|nr:DUF2868 domain-containing protein [Gammaproteobacteria bacterium]